MTRPDLGKYPITQSFGANPNKLGYGPAGHDGIDLGTPPGTSLYAPRSGKVVMVDDNKTYGKRIKIDNGKNFDYVGHLSQFKVTNGQQVNEGQLIGISGATGQITGPHTHWGVYDFNNKALNPLDQFNQPKGDSMVNEEILWRLYWSYLNRAPNAQDIQAWLKSGEKKTNDLILTLESAPERTQYVNGINGKLAELEALKASGDLEEVPGPLYRKKVKKG